MKGPRRGFTLLELLVAIAIFSVTAVMAYDGLRNFLAGRARLEQHTEAFAALVRTVGQLQQDFEQMAPRAVRDALGDFEPACRVFREEEIIGVMFTRFSAWPSSSARVADLRRVEYRLREGRLWRREWEGLDRIASTAFRERPLPLEMSSFSLRFLGSAGWQDDWPRGGEATGRDTVPRAVLVTLGLADGRSLTRLFRVGGTRP